MKLKFENISLIVGMVIVIISFAFFGRTPKIYTKLLDIGLLISIVSYLKILFRQGAFKYKITWTLIVVLGIIAQQITEPILIRLSYSVLVRQNVKNMMLICDILKNKTHNSMWVNDSTLWKRHGISLTEGSTIKKLIEGTNIIDIHKDQNRIFFRTYGMLDIHHGVSYYFNTNANHPSTRFKLIDNWYY